MGAFLRCYVCGLITPTADMFAGECPSCRGASEEDDPILERYATVSYTHLTLPTKRIV